MLRRPGRVGANVCVVRTLDVRLLPPHPRSVGLLDLAGPIRHSATTGHSAQTPSPGHPLAPRRVTFPFGVEEHREVEVPAGRMPLPVPVGHECGRQTRYIGHGHPLLHNVVELRLPAGMASNRSSASRPGRGGRHRFGTSSRRWSGPSRRGLRGPARRAGCRSRSPRRCGSRWRRRARSGPPGVRRCRGQPGRRSST